MTRQVTSPGAGIRIIVPGTWVNVPVDDPERSRAFIKRLVRTQVGTADRLARMRRDAAQELFASAREAALLGVHTYLMSLEMLPGVPFAAAMLMVDEDWPVDARGLVAGDVAAALRAGYPRGEVAIQRQGPVARVVEMTEDVVGEGDDATEMLTMRLEYHVPYPDRDRLLFVRVNVPNIPSAEPFALLFDEIIDSITFTSANDADDDQSAASSGRLA